MVIIPKVYKKVTGESFEPSKFFNYPDPRPPVRLLKSQTGLPANILEVVHSRSLELGTMDYITVQGDTCDEISEDENSLLRRTFEKVKETWETDLEEKWKKKHEEAKNLES